MKKLNLPNKPVKPRSGDKWVEVGGSGYKSPKKKSSSKDKRSQLAKSVVQHADIITDGLWISFDPSAGNRTGYAVWNRGELIESGVLVLSSGPQTVESRLYRLRRTMLDKFLPPQLIVVEMINFSAGGKSSGALQKAIGVMMTAWEVPCLEVAPSTWKKYLNLFPKYVKGDEADARMIGEAVRLTLAEQKKLLKQVKEYAE